MLLDMFALVDGMSEPEKAVQKLQVLGGLQVSTV